MHERRAWRPAGHGSPGPLNAGLSGADSTVLSHRM